MDSQNAFTRSILDEVPERQELRLRLEYLQSIGTMTAPVEREGRLFFTKRSGLENQPKVYLRKEGQQEDVVVIDPNEIDPAGTTAIDWWFPSWDGKYIAFGYSTGGDEQSTLHIVETDSGRRLDDHISGTRGATVAWLPDSSAFYYAANTRNLAADEQGVSAYYHRAVYLHQIGTDSLTDAEVFPDDNDPETQPAVSVSPNGRWLVVHVHRGWSHSDLYLRDLAASDGGFQWLTEGLDGLFLPTVLDDGLYIHTNYQAPHYRLMRARFDSPHPDGWTQVVEEKPDEILEDVAFFKGGIVLKYLRNAVSRLAAVDLSGKGEREIPLPELGTVTGLHAEVASHRAFFAFESFSLPATVYSYDSSRGDVDLWQRVESDVDVSRFVTEQKWYRSADGTRVSIFVVRPRSLVMDGKAPAVLTGYGGFNISRTPLFDRAAILWWERGGVYALANLRGGGEYGEEWHRAGMGPRKQNVFDDFIAAAEFLIDQRYTSADRLGIAGGSNGGLLVGAAFTQRPELYRAVVCSVPLLDMLRYHHFLIARLWIPEYGSADHPDQFRYLHAYSPYHHVRDDVEYPAILFLTAASDTRVDPMHARKMTALMQTTARSKGPILLRVEFSAGHGVGKPTSKLIEQLTDQWSFLAWQLGA